MLLGCKQIGVFRGDLKEVADYLVRCDLDKELISQGGTH